MKYTGKTAVVTGGGSGIGRAIAYAYAEEGASVVIADCDEKNGSETEKKINSTGGSSIFIKTDVSHPPDVEKMISETARKLGRIDILVNNAGVSVRSSVYSLSIEEWDMIINTNLRSVFVCSQKAAEIMKIHRGGKIINIASTRAFMSEPGSEAYAASKGGIVSLTHALAASLAPDKIQVNSISPGWIETGEYESLSEADHLQHFSQRVGRPDDIARACLFLTLPENDFITGTNFVIDGGMTKKMIYE